ncbi:MAG: uroporphyrinogen-III C-methyltransferase [Gammaproteobacteria bacterium]|nr:uroporphyrinogen-III C-methyltransferase [Gammaproteobacteria bacterium]
MADNAPGTDDAIELVVADTTSKTKKSTRLSIVFLYILFIALMSVTGAATYYFWQQQLLEQKNHQDQQTELTRLEQLLNKNQSAILTLNPELEANRQAIEKLQQEQQQLVAISSKAIETTNRNQRGWIMAEIDYLLQIANRRLQIGRDINSSVAALEAASKRLLDLADMSLFPVRKQLSIDIAKLKALHQVDINGTALAIDQMINHLNQLPFKTVQDEVETQLNSAPETTQDAAAEKNLVDSVLDTVMKIGDIKIHQRSIQPASSTQQQQQIEQLLHTHLLSARLGILRYDQAQFSNDINITRQLLHLHYKASDNRVAQMIKDLDDFSSLILNPDLPDITGAWNMLHNPGTQSQPSSADKKSEVQ